METITKDTLEIKTEFMGTFHKALVTPEFTYFVNYEEGDDNGNTKMYRNSTGELVSDNYFGCEDCIRALFEDEHIFISKESKENIPLMVEADFTLINSEVELAEDDSTSTYNVYVNDEGNIFVAVCGKNFFRYKLTKEISSMSEEEKFKVLSYCLCLVDSDDEVTLSDVFMQGEFVELIK